MGNGKFIGLVILVLIAISFIPIIGSSIAQRSTTPTSINESFTGSFTAQTLTNDDWTTNATVILNATDILVTPANYSLNSELGTVTLLESAYENQTLRATYTYYIDGYVAPSSIAGVILALIIGFISIGIFLVVLKKSGIKR